MYPQWHVLKPEATKHNDRNETSETTITATMAKILTRSFTICVSLLHP